MVTMLVNGCVNEILDFYTQSSWRSFFFSIENKIDVNDEQCSTWQEHKEDVLKKRIFYFHDNGHFFDLIISQNNKLIIGLIILHVKISYKDRNTFRMNENHSFSINSNDKLNLKHTLKRMIFVMIY